MQRCGNGGGKERFAKERRPRAVLCAATMAIVVSAGSSLALASTPEEGDPFSLSPEQLFDATIMSVSKSPEKLGDAAAAVFVLTNTDILRSGATSIAEVLRLVPGVQVARVSSSSWAISVRGFNGSLSNK